LYARQKKRRRMTNKVLRPDHLVDVVSAFGDPLRHRSRVQVIATSLIKVWRIQGRAYYVNGACWGHRCCFTVDIWNMEGEQKGWTSLFAPLCPIESTRITILMAPAPMETFSIAALNLQAPQACWGLCDPITVESTLFMLVDGSCTHTLSGFITIGTGRLIMMLVIN